MKILINYLENELKPTGGPSGYLYNIKCEKERLNDNELYFLEQQKNISLSDFISKLIRRTRYKTPDARYIDSIIYRSEHDTTNNYQDFDCVHFHSSFDMFACKSKLDNYSGTVILTSHSPKASHKELIEDTMSQENYQINKELFDYSEKFDEYAFKRADYIIFPCPGAEEPYYHSWSKYKEIRDEKKIRYVSTGILPVECKKTREEIRNELNIPQDATVLSFVGRHNEVKGYDILQNIFSKLDNVYVVCCGKIGSIQPLRSDRWIEVGWTTDPYSYVGASDIYMLPNRETYFDIAMLQTLSIGKCSVISNTGGNKEFTNTPGVKLYDSVEEAVQCIKHFIYMDAEEKYRLENLQRKEFNEKYTIEIFYKKYKETIKKLIKDR